MAVASTLCCGYPMLASAQDDPRAAADAYVTTGPELSRDEWRRKVDEARQRAKDVARQRREHPELYRPTPEDPDLVASERVLNDDSLKSGDIVATKKGLFVYRGRADQPRSGDDFVPVPPR